MTQKLSMKDLEELRNKATRYRKWASDTPDKRAAEALTALAEESEDKASENLRLIEAQAKIDPT